MFTDLFRWGKIAQVKNRSYFSRSAKSRDFAIFSDDGKSSMVSFLMAVIKAALVLKD